MKTYTIRLGDTDGPLLGILRLQAESKGDALDKARIRLERLRDGIEVDGSDFRIYTLPAEIHTDHITEDAA